MEENQPDISLEQAIKKTREAGIILNYDKTQTVAADLYELKKDIQKTNSSIETIKWIFGAVLVGAFLTTLVLLADYFQFATKAYQQFDATIKEQAADHKIIESMTTDIQSIKNTLNVINKN